MKESFKVVGLRVEKYFKQTCNGHNCDFTYGEELEDKHILLLLNEENRKYELELYEEEGECYSGWCVASWAYMNIKSVDRFNGYTHKPIKDIFIDLDLSDTDSYCKNDVFEFDSDGGDNYYPGGYYSINLSLFNANYRYKDKMPVWIFTGSSGTGKSYIANHIGELDVLETDSLLNLPDEITERIIVLGNKWNYDIEDITDRISDGCEVHIVKFE